MNNIAIVSGSHKLDGVSDRITVALSRLINEHLPDNASNILSLTNIPFWDEGMWGTPSLAENWVVWQPVAEALRAVDALIVVSPEYGGMVPPRLANFLLLCSGEEIGHKPALAVGVSASRGGAYPITQLRSYGYKNNHVCWLPDHLILRNCSVERDPLPEGSYENGYAAYCIKLLDAYATALKPIRNSSLIDHERYPYGL